MKNILRNPNFGFTKWCGALIAALMTFATTGWGQTSTQNFGTTAATNSSQTGNTSTIPNPTGSGTTWARGGVTAPNAPIIVATNTPNPLGTTGAYLRAVASTSTSVSKASPVASYTNATTEFYTSFKVLFGNSSGASGADTGVWTFYQGTGAMYTDASNFTGAQVWAGLQFTYGTSGAITLNYRNGSAWSTTSLTSSSLSQGTVYTVEIVANNKSSGTISYSYNGNSRTVAVQKFDLYINGTLVGDDLTCGQLTAGNTINAATFIGVSSTSNAANIFVDDFVVYNAVPSSIGGGAETTPAAPVVASASAISTSGFTANWAASSGATKYFLDVATDSGFTSFVTGYQNKDVGNVTSSAVTSLNAGTTYYYRVRANNSAGTSADSQTQVVLTTSAAAPAITPSVASLTGLSYNGAGPSTAQTLTLSVANLTGFPGSVTITGSTNYEVSTTSSSTGFGPSATLSYSDGNTLGSSTVWVRLKAGLAAGSYNAEIIGISGGDATSSFTASGSVTVPVISVTTTNLGSFIGTNGVGSAAKTNTVTGTNLAGAVTMVATNYFQLSSDAGSTYTNRLTLTPTVAGVLTNAVLFRIAPDAPVGNLGTNVVTITSPGAADKTVQVAGVVVYGGVTMAIAGASTATVVEGGANLTLNVTLSAAAPAGGTTVTLTTTDTDSSELGLSTTSVVFAAGETTKTVTLTPKTDSVFDTNQTIVITATAPDWSVAGTVSVTVTNTDAMPIAKISLSNSGGGTYTQNFDALGTVSIADAISGTVGAPASLAAVTGSSPLNGWYATKIVGSATTATAITADNGNGNSGLVYNYGVASATDRALGVLASGTSTMAIGALIKNDTASIINSITVSFTAEFWRSSTTTQNVLTCAVGKVDGTTITTGNFLTAATATPLVTLNITGPTPVVAPNGPLNGNDVANRVAFSGVSIPLQLNPGETAFVRWSDANDDGNDAGLAIDDLSLAYGVDSSVKITSFVASSGPVGTQVTINGANFTSGMPVKFNGIASPLVSFVSASQIVATVPEGATTGYITVGDGAGAVVSATAFVVGDFAVTTPLDGMNFGSVSVGSTGVDKNLVIMGAGLPGGTLNIESDSPDFLLSEDGSAWSSSLSIPYDGSFATPYIRFAPLTTGAKTGVVTLSSGGITVAKYTFTGTANSLQNVTGFAAVSGNSQISLSWTNASPSTKVIILAQQGSAVTNSPVATNSYTASTVYGSGTQVGTSYVVFNSTGTNVTVTGLTNRLLYYFKAFNVSGDNVSSGTSVSAIPYVALSNVITQWNFNGSTTTPSSGTGTAQATGGTIIKTTYATGSPTDSLGAGGVGNVAWTLESWTGGSTETAGVQFNVSTAGRGNIVISWDALPSNTGPKYYRLLYTTDASVVSPVWVAYNATGSGAESGLYVNPVSGSWTIQNQADLSGVSGLQNNPNAAFRLVSAYAPGTSAYAAAQSGSTAGSGGTLRLDMVTVSGVVGVFNNPPTNITLSATTIAENNAVNAVVGTFSTTDSDVGDSFTYTLVSGTGDANNASFNISGSSLRAGVAFNFEALSSYSIRVRTTDSGGGTFEKVFTISVNNVIDSPADYKADWLAANGLAAGSDWNSDPNSVGYSLATAYAFGLDPRVRSGAPITIVSSPAGSVKIVYMQRNSISGIIYTVKSGTDLAAGLNGTVTPVVSAVQPSPGKLGYTQYEATYTPSAPATKGFLKVEAFVP